MCHIQRNGLKRHHHHHRSTAIIFAWLDFASIQHTLNFESNFLNMMRVYVLRVYIYFPKKNIFFNLNIISISSHHISFIKQKKVFYCVAECLGKNTQAYTNIRRDGKVKTFPFTYTHSPRKKKKLNQNGKKIHSLLI